MAVVTFILIIGPAVVALFFLTCIAYFVANRPAPTVYDNRQYHYTTTNNYGANAQEIAQIILLALDQGAKFYELRSGKVVAQFLDGSKEVLNAEEAQVLREMDPYYLPSGKE